MPGASQCCGPSPFLVADGAAILAEMDPQSLGGQTPALEFYDLQTDRDEMHNLAGDASRRPQIERLFAALKKWSSASNDVSAPLPGSP